MCYPIWHMVVRTISLSSIFKKDILMSFKWQFKIIGTLGDREKARIILPITEYLLTAFIACVTLGVLFKEMRM